MLGIHDHLKKCDDNVCREVLEALLSGYRSPAFGALPKREIDLLFYEALENSVSLRRVRRSTVWFNDFA